MSSPTLTPRRNEDGFTLIETIVALSMALMVMIGCAAGLAAASQAEREAVSVTRARALVEQLTAQIEAMDLGQVGHYQDDGVPASIDLPEKLCGSNLSTMCTAQKPIMLAGNRPTSPAPRMPQLVETYTFDGAPIDASAKLARRTFEVTTYVMYDGTSTILHPERETPRRVAFIVRWKDGTHEREYSRSRRLSITDDLCANRAKVSDTVTTNKMGCVGLSAMPYGTYPAGETNDSNTTVPVRVSGSNLVLDAPLKVYWDIPDTSTGGLVSSGPARLSSPATAARVTLWNGTTVLSLIKTPGTTVWTGTIPRSSTYKEDTELLFSATFADGRSTAPTALMITNGTLDSATWPELRGVGTTSGALPGPTGSPTGALRLGVTNSATLDGTVTPRLCTKTDGTLWSNQALYIDIVNTDPQDISAGAGSFTDVSGYSSTAVRNTRTTFDFEYLAHQPDSTLSNKIPDTFGRFNATAGGGGHEGVRYVSLVSGAQTIGALNTTRYKIFFPTQATANSRQYRVPSDVTTSQWWYPKFFQKRINVSFTVFRPYDQHRQKYTISIPVYRSTTGTSSDCISGTATQPNYG